MFLPDGVIAEGNNRNEHRWRLFRKKLELLQLDGRVHSRFVYDSQEDRWKHTDEPDTLSIRGQCLEPERSRPDIGLQPAGAGVILRHRG